MATLIRHTGSLRIFILIGSGYAMFQSEKPNWILGNFSPDKQAGGKQVICACDENGKIV